MKGFVAAAMFAVSLSSFADVEKIATMGQGGIALHWWPKVVVPDGWHHERGPSLQNGFNVLVPNGFDFRMWRTGAAVPAPADDPTAFDQKRPDHRIRRSCAVTTTGQAQCLAHVFEFSAHPTKLRRPC